MQFITLLRPERRVNVAARTVDPSPPAACYESCEDAYLAAQKTGKTPSLCPDNSDFMRFYKSCYACVLAKADHPREAVSAYLEPTFSPYISYCQEQKNIDPSWYTSTTTWAIATYTNQNGPTVTVTVLVDTTVLRPDWTGFQTTTSMSPATTSQANTITSSQPLTTTSSTPDKPNNKDSTHGPSPWVWAIVGAVIALAVIGLGILLFLYKKGKLRFFKKKCKLGEASAHSHSHELDGDSTWRTGDKPELHGESSSMAAAATPVKELYTPYNEPKELDSSVRPVELDVDNTLTGNGTRVRLAELPAEFTSTGGGVTGDLSEGRGGKEAGGEHRRCLKDVGL